jgi:Nucleotidyltransferase of unknown function (DUF6036)
VARQVGTTMSFTDGRRRNAPHGSASRSGSRGIGWRAASRLPGERPVAEIDQPLDAERILRVLDQREVEYVLIGGLAVQTHGHVRTTNDADLIPAPDPGNLERLASALRDLDARVLNPGQEEVEVDATMLPRATIWQFATPDGGIDVMREAPGGRSYAELSDRALHVKLGEVDVPVVGLDDLIQMKLARGRAVDLADVAALTDPDVELGP